MVSNDTNKYKNKIFTIPNILSFVRLCLIPFFVWLYCFELEKGFAAIVFIISGITDVADGFIARRFNMVSDFGKFFDPIADKLTQITVLACLIWDYPLLSIPFALLVVKEILAAALNMLTLKKTGVVVAAVWHGKLTTVVIYITIFIHIVWPLVTTALVPNVVSKILIFICIGIMILSSVLYTKSDVKALKQEK